MDKALKQRLVGASVLIVLAVVVLPMLFSGQSVNPQESRSIEVPPSPEELSFETRRFPLGEQAGTPTANSVPRQEPRVSAPEQVAGQEEDESPSSPEPGASEPVAATPPAEPSPLTPPETSGRYLVQVASFSTTSNANRLAARLREDDMAVLLDSIDAAVGTLHRVRVGPFDEIGDADDAMARIRARTPDVNPRIIDLRPDETAPVTDPSDPLARWVVQVGSFAERDNAEKLVAQLRSEGFTAFDVAVHDAAGTQYKVRVGPEIERQSAVGIMDAIHEKMGLEGIVMVGD